MKFYLFFYDSNLKDLLLAEIKLKHPQLTLSFSNKKFISMKGPENYEHHLQNKPVIFAQRMAIFIEKGNTPPSHHNFIEAAPGQYWHYQTIKSKIDTLDMVITQLEPEIPARAYSKMREAHILFNLDLKKGQKVIEIGSAPGGISYYLLSLDMKLSSVDPADMAPIISQKFKENFNHIKKSIFDVDRRDLPKSCDWIISDLNLKGDLNIAQSKRIMDYYPRLKGAFLTIKTPRPSDLSKINGWIETLSDNYHVTPLHLPSHRREIGFIIFK